MGNVPRSCWGFGRKLLNSLCGLQILSSVAPDHRSVVAVLTGLFVYDRLLFSCEVMSGVLSRIYYPVGWINGFVIHIYANCKSGARLHLIADPSQLSSQAFLYTTGFRFLMR